MMNYVRLELYKMRHKHLYTMITLVIMVEIAWAFMSLSIAISRNASIVGWKDIIMTFSSMNGLFLPIICAVVVSRICDMEHKGNTLKLLMSTIAKTHNIFFSKYVCECILLFYASVLQVVFIIIFGSIYSFEQPVPYILLLKFMAGTMITNLVIISLQQWISLTIKNQAFALCIGMIGGFIGMTGDLFPMGIRRLFIWSYYSNLSPVTYDYVNDSMIFVTRNTEAYLLVMIIGMGLIIYTLGNLSFCRKEV